MFDMIARTAKAVTAGLGAGSAAAATALANDGEIVGLEWVSIVTAIAVVGWGTWQVRNRPAGPPA